MVAALGGSIFLCVPVSCQLLFSGRWCCSTKQRAGEPAEQSPGAAASPWNSAAWQGQPGHQGPPAGIRRKAACWGLYLFLNRILLQSGIALMCNKYVLGTKVVYSQMLSLLCGLYIFLPNTPQTFKALLFDVASNRYDPHCF